MNKGKKGFTIVELVIVIAVIAVLTVALIPVFSGIIKRANDTAAYKKAKDAMTSYIVMNDGNLKENSVIAVKHGSDFYYYAYINGSLQEIKKYHATNILTDPEFLVVSDTSDLKGSSDVISIVNDATGSKNGKYDDDKTQTCTDIKSGIVIFVPKDGAEVDTEATATPEPTATPTPEPNYLTFTATKASTVTASFSSGSFEYSVDGGTKWNPGINGYAISIAKGEKVLFRGETCTTNKGSHFSMTGKIAASGSVTSLLDGNGNISNVVLTADCFSYMFYKCTALTTAPKLPATTLASNCYSYMFYKCTALTTAPELPANTLASSCYGYMFSGCTALTAAPALLPAETLESNCYEYMFSGCNKLTTAPELPATTLVASCYSYMFSGCTALTTAPVLPATTLASKCYKNMFYNCSALKVAPKLPATTLAESCYSYMFCNCTALTTAPELPAKTLKDYCYRSMFSGCTSLKISESNPIKGANPSGILFTCPSDTSPTECMKNIFYNSSGPYTKTPKANKTYYWNIVK